MLTPKVDQEGQWARETGAGGRVSPARRSSATRFGARLALALVLIVGAGCITSRDQAQTQWKLPNFETSRLLSNARYYRMMGRPEAALKELEEAHRQDPGNLKIVDTLARNYEELGYPKRAQELYREALTHKESHRGLQNNLCYSYYLQGNLGRAEKCFKEALERDPGNAAARNNLGLLLCREGRLAEAQRLWEEADGAIAAQNRMNQALAFLGKKEASHYARIPEPAPKPLAAAPVKPAAPIAVASLAKSPSVEGSNTARVSLSSPPAPAPALAELKPAGHPGPAIAKPLPTTENPIVAMVSPSAPAAAAPKAEIKEAARQVKPAEAVPAAAASPLKVPAPAAPAAVPVLTPVPPVAALPKAEPQVAVKPLEPKPLTPTPVAARTRPIAPAVGASPVKVQAAAAPVAVPVLTPAPPVAALPQAKPQMAAKPLEPRPATPTHSLTVSKPVSPAPVAVLASAGLTKPSSPALPPAPTAKAGTKMAPKLAAAPAEVKTQPSSQIAALQPAAAAAAPAKTATPKANKTLKAATPARRVAALAKTPGRKAAKVIAPPAPLTAAEREKTRIEVRNGTRARFLAHYTRDLLTREVFNVTLAGNYIDFGAKSTVIYYRPGAKKVARTLNYEIFPKVKLVQTTRLRKGTDLKILLGNDLLNQPRTMARLTGRLPGPSTEIARLDASEIGPQPQQKASVTEPVPALVAQTALPVAEPRAQKPVLSKASAPKLTDEELLANPVEIRNGTRCRFLAHDARSLLSLEGYKVGIIGNYIDFGAKTTVIYYRPGAEKVARALGAAIFPGAQLTGTSKLKKGIAIKVVLGHDLLQRSQLLALLAAN
jgi:Tfp pilus assembly protein PilF